jgi:hypothetical protein
MFLLISGTLLDKIILNHLVNGTKSTLPELIRFRKVIYSDSNSAEVELQGFHATNHIIFNSFTWGKQNLNESIRSII